MPLHLIIPFHSIRIARRHTVPDTLSRTRSRGWRTRKPRLQICRSPRRRRHRPIIPLFLRRLLALVGHDWPVAHVVVRDTPAILGVGVELHVVALFRVARDDVPGVQKAGDEAEAAECDVDQGVDTADAAFHPYCGVECVSIRLRGYGGGGDWRMVRGCLGVEMEDRWGLTCEWREEDG